MATAVSSSTKIATATAMLAAVLVARTSRLTIFKPHALRNPGSPHLQSTVSLSRVEPPSPSSFPPRLSLNHDRHPSGDKNTTHIPRESQGVKADRTAQKLSSLSNPRVHFRQYPPRAVSASGIPRQFGGRSMRRLVGPLSAMLTQRQGPNGERKKPRHGGRDVMAGSISRGLSPLVFSFIFSVYLLALVIVVLGHGQRIIDQS